MKRLGLLILCFFVVSSIFATPIESPQIQQLVAQVEMKGRGVAEAFWAERTQHGGPLVEPLDEGRVRVTFLWQATEPTTNVRLEGGPALHNPKAAAMQHIDGTDVWYTSMVCPSRLRSTYWFAVNGTAWWEGDTVEEVHENLIREKRKWRSDPLNTVHFTYPAAKEEDAFAASVLELPDAPAQTILTPQKGVQPGKVVRHTFGSAQLNNTRDVWVYTPAVQGPYQLLVLFDGGAYLESIPTPTILDNLIAKGKIPPTAAILIGNVDQESRDYELTCCRPFADFVAKELLPWAHEQLPLAKGAEHVIAGGSSYGGLAAAYLAYCHPNQVGNVLSQSGAFWYSPNEGQSSWLVDTMEKNGPPSARFYLDVGELETTAWFNGPTMIEVNQRLAQLLEEHGKWVHYTTFCGGHDYVCWRATLADGLVALLQDH